MKQLKGKSVNDSINLISLTLIRAAKFMNFKWKREIARYFKLCKAASTDLDKSLLMWEGSEMLSRVILLLKTIK